MSIPALTGVIRNGSGGLPTINLVPASGYQVMFNGLGLPGQETYRREYALSRFVPGAALMSAVLDQQTGPLVVLIEATTIAQLWARIGTLRAAVRQFSYFVDITIGSGADTVTETYDCDPADTALGSSGLIDESTLDTGGPFQVMTLTIPHAPIP